jgi:hypothetical protein
MGLLLQWDGCNVARCIVHCSEDILGSSKRFLSHWTLYVDVDLFKRIGEFVDWLSIGLAVKENAFPMYSQCQ